MPKGVEYKGDIQKIIRYTDKLGDNIVITTADKKKYMDEEIGEELSDHEIYSYHYLNVGGRAKLLSKVYDFNKSCMFDIRVQFIADSPIITDLNDDGIAEIWVMYVTECSSDVSGAPIKIIMYSNNKKYAMRGRYMVKTLDWSDGGEYKFDSAFNNAPKAFRDFAVKLWNKNIMGR